MAGGFSQQWWSTSPYGDAGQTGSLASLPPGRPAGFGNELPAGPVAPPVSGPGHRAVRGYLVAVAALILVYYPFALLGGVGNMVQLFIYNLVYLSAAAALVIGTWRNRPRWRAPWLLLAAGELLTTCGEISFDIAHRVYGNDAYPSLADALYLSAYPLLALGLLMLVRHRTPGWDTPSIIDATIIAISAAMLAWIFLISPLAFDEKSTLAARLVSIAYPLMDLLLLVVAARLMLGAGARTTSFWLLVGFLGLLLLADTIYGLQSLLNVYSDGNFLDAVWMASAAALGAAGLHPSMRMVAEPSPAAGPEARPGRLLILAAAAILAPVTLLVQYLRSAPTFIPLVSATCIGLFLLVLGRMSAMVRTQRDMGITDPLTGVRTRQYLDEALSTEADRVYRHQQSLGLLFVDIDHFKRVNETYGHHAGDRVLCEVARRLGHLVRPGDLVARYGGEEFALLLPNATTTELTSVGEYVRRGVANTPVTVERDTAVTITVSIGAAALPDHAKDPNELAIAADRALNAAKEAGRNRVITAGLGRHSPLGAATFSGEPLRTQAPAHYPGAGFGPPPSQPPEWPGTASHRQVPWPRS